jgi:hypothetical protein
MPAGGEIDLDYTTGFVDTASVSGLGFYSDNIFGFGPPVTFSQSFILGLSQSVCCVPQRQMDWFGFTLADLVGGFFTTGTMSGAGGWRYPFFLILDFVPRTIHDLFVTSPAGIHTPVRSPIRTQRLSPPPSRSSLPASARWVCSAGVESGRTPLLNFIHEL